MYDTDPSPAASPTDVNDADVGAQKKADKAAVWSVRLALLSFCFSLFTSVPAVYLAIKAWPMTSVSGRRYAMLGAGLGSLMVVLNVAPYA